MTKVLVTGANGMLGQDLCPILEDNGYDVVETDIQTLDVTNPEMVDDRIGCPTWTVDLSDAIIKIIENKPYGTYHTCGGGSTSWYGFAKEIFEMANIKANLKPCMTEEFSRPAKRPAYSIIDNGGLLRDWKIALKSYIALRIEV